MSIRSSIKLAALMSAASIAVLLSACSKHENPLQVATEKESSTFLAQASTFAELSDKSIHLVNGRGGYYYGECMRGKHKLSTCNRIYEEMVKYGKKKSRL